MPDYSRRYGEFVARWKTGDCNEHIHVHIASNSNYNAAKIWISVDETRVILEHNKGGVPNKILEHIFCEVITNRAAIEDDWHKALKYSGGFTYIDASGYLVNKDYHPPLEDDAFL